MSQRTKLFWAFVLLVALGAFLRLTFMRVHGLDPDDMFTIQVAQQPASYLVSNFLNTNIEDDPLLFHLMYHFWLAVAGISEAAVRLPGILADLLLGAFLIQTARSRFGGRAALLVGALWSTNPLLVWVTGFARMYSLLGLLATLAWVCLLRGLTEGRARWWIGFGAAAVMAAYIHVLGLIVLISAGSVVVLWAVLHRKFAGVAVMAGVGLAYLPFLAVLWRVLFEPRRLAAISLPHSPLDFVAIFISGLLANTPPLPVALIWAITCLCLLLVGLALKAQARAWVGTLIVIFVVVSVGSGYLALKRTIFDTRYVSYVAPVFLLLVAVGISRVRPVAARASALIVLLGAGAVGMVQQMQPSARHDFPSAARFVGVYADQGDLILVMTSFAESTFEYYYRGDGAILAPWHHITPDTSLDDLPTVVQGYDTAWLVLHATNSADPENRLDGWFRARYPVRTEAFPPGVTIRGYDLRPMTRGLPPEATPLDAVFEGQVALRGYQVYQRDVSRRDDRLHPPSGWVHVTLYWETITPGVAFEPRVQIENDLGEIYGVNLVRGTEVFDLHPTSTWLNGEVWRSDFDINLNPEMPPGEYKIVLRVFSPGDARAWTISGGTNAGSSWLIVERVGVEP